MAVRTFDVYLAREILVPLVAGLGLFIVVAAFAEVLKVSDAVTGMGISLTDMGALLAYSMPPLLGMLLPISGLYATLLGIGRLSAERELLALAQAGAGPTTLLRVPAFLGLLLALLSGISMWVGEPWGIRGVRQKMADGTKAALIAGVQPGRFYGWNQGLTFWAEGKTGTTLTRVLMADHRHSDRPVMVSAATGALINGTTPGELLFVMSDGEVLMDDPDPDVSHVVRFAQGVWRFNVADMVGRKLRNISDVQELTPRQLLAQSQDASLSHDARTLRRITLHRKFAVPAAAFIFCLLAVPLGSMAKNQARARGLLVCTLIVAGYYYLGRSVELAARSGATSAALAAWLPDGLGAGACAVLFWRMARGRV